MNLSLAQYKEAPILTFPLKLKSGLDITELIATCSDCGGKLVSLRGCVTEYENCSDIRFAGLCNPCKLLVTCHFRHYKDGRVSECRDDTWRDMKKGRKFSFIKWIYNKLTWR
jgi:hypothetical protein